MFRVVTLALNAPLRRGQILAIKPDDIDFDNSRLLVISSKGRDARLVPLNSTAVLTLRAMLNDGQLPFPLKSWRKRWCRALINAGINEKEGKRGENFVFHDLRKEFASELIRQNVNPGIIQRLFAHSSLSLTDVYMHTDMDALSAAVNTLDATVLQPSQENEDFVN